MEEKRIWKEVQEKVFKFDTSRNVDEKKNQKVGHPFDHSAWKAAVA